MSYHHPEQSFPNQEFMLHKDYSEHTAELIDAEVRKLISDNEQRTLETLTAHRTELDKIAEALIERESLDDSDVADLVNSNK